MSDMEEIVVASGWRQKLEDLVARRRESWPLVVLVGSVAIASLVLAGRGGEPRIAPPAQAAPPSSTLEASPSGPSLMVHVAGAVRKPGLYELPEGARVADAISSAGGPVRRADLDALNLAALLIDGVKVEVAEVGEVPPTATGTPLGASNPVISLSSADQVALETIPGIGPVTAAAILAYRSEIGAFESLEQLLEVDGIGPATYDNIRSYLTL